MSEIYQDDSRDRVNTAMPVFRCKVGHAAPDRECLSCAHAVSATWRTLLDFTEQQVAELRASITDRDARLDEERRQKDLHRRRAAELAEHVRELEKDLEEERQRGASKGATEDTL